MKKYSLNVEFDDEGKLHVESHNDGFSALEILGLLEWKKSDIENQMRGSIKPDSVSRQLVKD